MRKGRIKRETFSSAFEKRPMDDGEMSLKRFLQTHFSIFQDEASADLPVQVLTSILPEALTSLTVEADTSLTSETPSYVLKHTQTSYLRLP